MYHLLMSKIAPGKNPALEGWSAGGTCYAVLEYILEKSEKNSYTTELSEVVHEAVAHHH
jgi:hypothetical protein